MPLKGSSDLPLGDIRAGSLQVTLAANEDQLRQAQELRYRVFVKELGAKVPQEMHDQQRDYDKYDAACDHLLVLEHDTPSGEPEVVGTYRLLRRSRMKQIGSFYTASEFDVSAVEKVPGEILELGRSCVAPEYRNRAVMQLLWRGNGAYVGLHDITLMFGCASFHGIDPKDHAQALSYLHYKYLAPESMRLKALPERYVPMNILSEDEVDERQAVKQLPALIKGYLRLGGYIGEGAVIDAEYNTTDVGIIVKTELVTEKYSSRYGKDQG